MVRAARQPPLLLREEERTERPGGGDRVGGVHRRVGRGGAGMNCIKLGLPGKLMLSKRKGLQEVLFP